MLGLRSVKSKIFVSIFAMSLLVLGVLAYICYNYIYTSITRYELNYAISSTDDAVRNIELFLRTMDDDIDKLLSEPALYTCLVQGGSESTKRLNGLLKDFVSAKPYISNLYIHAADGTTYNSTDWGNYPHLLRDRIEAISAYESEKFTPLHNYMSPTRSNSVISYYTTIPSPYGGSNPGTLYIDLDYNNLSDLFVRSTAKTREKAILVNETGEIIMGFPIYVDFEPLIRENPEIFTAPYSIIDRSIFRQPSIVVSDRVRDSNWILVRIISKDGIYKDADRLLMLLVSVSAMLFLASLILSYLMANAITRPISELFGKIRRVESGDLTVRGSPTARGDELQQLSSSFDRMVVRLDDYLQSEIETQKRKSDMEFQVLQSQINPHFLYNTLDSVKWLAAMQKEDNICNMVSALISTLRYNLSSKQSSALVRQEMENIQDYITIQKYRYGNAFDLQYDLEEAVLDCTMLRFTLQPLVENAIFHGMENYTASGLIRIRGWVRETDFVVEVADNGPGFGTSSPAPDTLRRKMKNQFSGVGLTNIKERYELLYREGFRMELSDDAELGGANIRLIIPLAKPDP